MPTDCSASKKQIAGLGKCPTGHPPEFSHNKPSHSSSSILSPYCFIRLQVTVWFSYIILILLWQGPGRSAENERTTTAVGKKMPQRTDGSYFFEFSQTCIKQTRGSACHKKMVLRFFLHLFIFFSTDRINFEVTSAIVMIVHANRLLCFYKSNCRTCKMSQVRQCFLTWTLSFFFLNPFSLTEVMVLMLWFLLLEGPEVSTNSENWRTRAWEKMCWWVQTYSGNFHMFRGGQREPFGCQTSRYFSSQKNIHQAQLLSSNHSLPDVWVKRGRNEMCGRIEIAGTNTQVLWRAAKSFWACTIQWNYLSQQNNPGCFLSMQQHSLPECTKLKGNAIVWHEDLDKSLNFFCSPVRLANELKYKFSCP